jgi:hypothetical protein
MHLENGQLFLKKKLLHYRIYKIIKNNNQIHPLSVLIYTYKSHYYFSFNRLNLKIKIVNDKNKLSRKEY